MTLNNRNQPATRIERIAQRTNLFGRKLVLLSGAAAIAAIVAVDPAAAQEFGGGGGGQIETFLQNFLPWALRWMLVIGALIGVFAHMFAGWTSDPDKAFRRKEWRNRAIGGVALAIPILLILNAIIVQFGGEAIDFIPFV